MEISESILRTWNTEIKEMITFIGATSSDDAIMVVIKYVVQYFYQLRLLTAG